MNIEFLNAEVSLLDIRPYDRGVVPLHGMAKCRCVVCDIRLATHRRVIQDRACTVQLALCPECGRRDCQGSRNR